MYAPSFSFYRIGININPCSIIYKNPVFSVNRVASYGYVISMITIDCSIISQNCDVVIGDCFSATVVHINPISFRAQVSEITIVNGGVGSGAAAAVPVHPQAVGGVEIIKIAQLIIGTIHIYTVPVTRSRYGLPGGENYAAACCAVGDKRAVDGHTLAAGKFNPHAGIDGQRLPGGNGNIICHIVDITGGPGGCIDSTGYFLYRSRYHCHILQDGVCCQHQTTQFPGHVAGLGPFH